MKINSIDKEIHSIFESSFYLIPRFQRPYSWDKENIFEFWNDTVQNNENEYFIGSIVVYKTKDKTYGVVDGQQRLTTITIILAALRETYELFKYTELAHGIHSLIEKKDIRHMSRFVLKTETSFPYFQEYIQKFGNPDIDVEVGTEEKGIQNAFKLIKSYINEIIDDIRNNDHITEEEQKSLIEKKLNEIRDKILDLKVIFIELDNENDAYLIFETLNTRGKDLAPADLVKNLLTRFIKPTNEGVDVMRLKWSKILDNIENAPGELSINNFIHHHWLANYDYTSTKKLYKFIRQTIKRVKANDYLSELEYDSIIYRYINEPTFRDWDNHEKKIRDSLQGLDIFNVRQPLPLLLAILSKYERKMIWV